MRKNIKTAFKYILEDEGNDRYTNDPRDPGGATKYGVTDRTFAAWLAKKGSLPRHVSTITEGEAQQIFLEDYWSLVRADDLPTGIDYVVSDTAYHSGVGPAITILQQALNTVGDREILVDGKIGAITVHAAKCADRMKLMDAILDKRLEYMQTRKGWKHFEKGWRNRVMKVRNRARAWIELEPKDETESVVPIPETIETKPKGESPMSEKREKPVTFIAVVVASLLAALGKVLGVM